MALDQEKDGPGEPAQQSEVPGALTPAGARRRRLAGLGASGVLMTLASQSAMADLVCKSPSAALSGNLASRSPGAVSCLGRGPGFWKNNQSAWVGVASSDRFSQHFFCGGTPGLSEASCLDILSHQDFDKSNVAMHIMATYLNVTSGRISFMTQEGVLAMWREFLTTNAYVPAAGAAPWNAADLVMYLSSTQKAGDEASTPALPKPPKETKGKA